MGNIINYYKTMTFEKAFIDYGFFGAFAVSFLVGMLQSFLPLSVDSIFIKSLVCVNWAYCALTVLLLVSCRERVAIFSSTTAMWVTLVYAAVSVFSLSQDAYWQTGAMLGMLAKYFATNLFY